VPQRFFSGVSKDDVLAAQSKWAKTIETISATQKNGGEFVQTAADAAGELYAYGHTEVLFKPTMASEYQFRPTPKSAISYFIGGSNVDGGYDEDDASLSTVAKAGRSACTTTTTLSSRAILLSRWAITISPAPLPTRRPRQSTPLAIYDAMMGSFAYFCTIRPFRTLVNNSPISPERRGC
jgi:hypothetical protein